MSFISDINNVNGYINKNTSNYSAPVNFNVGNGVIGSYDNIKFNKDFKKPKIQDKNNLFFVPQGTPLPLKNEMIYTELPKDSMFIFADSYASPDCCPSTFSTDRGCICTTDFQKKYISEQRGLNKSYSNYNF
jgi:hypothetical protein